MRAFGTHKQGCTYGLYVKTTSTGSVVLTASGEHLATCGAHAATRRLHPTVKAFIETSLRNGASIKHIFDTFHDPTSVPSGALLQSLAGTPRTPTRGFDCHLELQPSLPFPLFRLCSTTLLPHSHSCVSSGCTMEA